MRLERIRAQRPVAVSDFFQDLAIKHTTAKESGGRF